MHQYILNKMLLCKHIVEIVMKPLKYEDCNYLEMNDLRSSIEWPTFELSSTSYLLHYTTFSQLFQSLLHYFLFER